MRQKMSEDSVLRSETPTATAGRSFDRWYGRLLISCFALHLANCYWRGHWSDALWACHIATLSLGVGLLSGNATAAGIGALCLVVGAPLWLIDVSLGASLVSTSILTHAFGWAIALIYLLRRQSVPGLWWKTLFALGLLQACSRLATPPQQNVNAAFDVYPSVAPWFDSYFSYWLALSVGSAFIFWIMDYVLVKTPRTRSQTSGTSIR